MTIHQRSIMVTQSVKGILGPISHMSANWPLIALEPTKKDFENLWYRYDQKNEIFKLSTFTP